MSTPQYQHLSQLEGDGGTVSAMMQRVEQMIRSRAPMLLKLPHTNTDRMSRPVTLAEKQKIIEMHNAGAPTREIVKATGIDCRAIRYYRRYANGYVPGSTMRTVAIAPSGA